jgi:hypothetical protein
MNRRDFLRMLGMGAAAAAVPGAAANPWGRPEDCDSRVIRAERRIWQVPSNAPVGSRICRVGSRDITFEPREGELVPWLEYKAEFERRVPGVVGIDYAAGPDQTVVLFGEASPEQLEHWGYWRVRQLTREELAGMWRPG